MVKKLSQLGLVHHAPYKSIQLTPAIGEELEVVKVTNEAFEFLKFLEDIELIPAARFILAGATEFDGVIHLKIEDSPITVGREVSRHVWVKRAC